MTDREGETLLEGPALANPAALAHCEGKVNDRPLFGYAAGRVLCVRPRCPGPLVVCRFLIRAAPWNPPGVEPPPFDAADLGRLFR